MPYADPKKQREAQLRHYHAKRARIAAGEQSTKHDAVHVPVVLSDDPHEIVALTKKALDRQTRDRVSTKGRVGIAWIECSREFTDRALRLLQAVVVAAEAEGHVVERSKRRRKSEPDSQVEFGIRFLVRGYGFDLQITELMDRETVPPDPNSKPLFSWREPSPTYRYTPNGRLQMELGVGIGRQRWSDNKRASLDAQLGHVVASISSGVERWQAKDRKEREREERRSRLLAEFEAEESERERTFDVKRAEKWRPIEVVRIADAFEQSRRLHALLDELRERGDEQADRWRSWLEDNIDQIDPARELPDFDPDVATLNRDVPERFQRRGLWAIPGYFDR